MEPFQATKSKMFGVKPYLISFGNLGDLQRIQRFGFDMGVNQQLRRQFHPGNYVLSKLTNDESNLSLIIHHENVDAKAISKILHEKSMEIGTTPAASADVGEAKNSDGDTHENDDIDDDDDETEHPPIEICAASVDGNKSLIGSSDWFKESRDEDGKGQCNICDETNVILNHPTISIVDYVVMHKIYDARIQFGDDPDEAKSKASKYLDLLFVVNNLKWTDTTEWKLTPIDDGQTYYLELEDGEKIGFAFDMGQYFGEELVRGILLQDSSDQSVFAMILESEDANLLRPEVFARPMSEFFYASEYRRFVENGQNQVNPYFGVQDDRSPFANLPPNLFVEIVSYLTLKERVSVRRVNTHWRKISNDVLAVGTKRIDLQRNDMIKDWTNADMNRMIPLVAGGLESMVLPKATAADPIDFGFICPNVSFRSLLEIDMGRFSFDCKFVKVLMETAPGLQKFTGNIRLDAGDEDAVGGDQRSFQSVEELITGRHNDDDGAINIGDSYLSALIGLFPNVRRLSLHNLNYVSATGASAMAERLGPTLEQLEMRFVSNGPNTWDEAGMRVRAAWIPPLGVFDGIRSCINLKTLVLVNSHYVSDGFADALVNGCPLLETLVLTSSLLPNGSSAPLKKLAALSHLTKLNVSDVEGVSDGLMPVVRKGHLEQLIMPQNQLTVELVSACIRYCTGLLLLDIGSDEFTPDEVVDIITLYGQYGCTPRTVVRTTNHAWRSDQVGDLQLAIKDGGHPHSGSFVIDMRYTSFGFVENAIDEYEAADPNVLRLEPPIDEDIFEGLGGSDDGEDYGDDDGYDDYGDEEDDDVDEFYYDHFLAV